MALVTPLVIFFNCAIQGKKTSFSFSQLPARIFSRHRRFFRHYQSLSPVLSPGSNRISQKNPVAANLGNLHVIGEVKTSLFYSMDLSFFSIRVALQFIPELVLSASPTTEGDTEFLFDLPSDAVFFPFSQLPPAFSFSLLRLFQCNPYDP